MIDFKKFIHYSRPGPRYTSYPTALEFSETFTYDDYLQAIKASNNSGRPLSLYVHLPYCRSACYFCGCNVVYTSKEEKKERYIAYLEKELAILASSLDTTRPVQQLHFGGGTPTFFGADQLSRIITMIKGHFPHFTPEAELSCEVDPRYFNEDQAKVLTANGFNRLSFGVQDFEPKVQEAVHRVQSFEMTQNVMRLARKYGVNSINIDLIYGLPYQTLESFQKTLEMTLSLDPDRLAVFNYAHVPWMKKTMRKIDETTLPVPETKLAIMQYTTRFFTSHGYRMIGMDHFAKPGDELFRAIDKGELHRNFQGYTTKGGADLFGIGITSIGEGEAHYAQNYKEIDDYEKAIDSGRLPLMRGVSLNEDDRIRKAVIMQLMSNFSLRFATVEEAFGIDFHGYFKEDLDKLKPMEADALLEIHGDGITISETGKLLVRNIAMAFDAYMKKHEGNKKSFSKTV